MVLSGVKNICWASGPGWTGSDVLYGIHPLGEYDAVGPWSDAVDDGNSGEFTDVTEVRNGVEVHISTLTFKLCDNVDLHSLPTGCNRQCWRFRERDGKTYFIGTGARPYPVRVTNTENSRGSNAKSRTVTVTWTSTVGPMILKRYIS